MAKAKKTKSVVQPRAPEHEHASCKALGQVLDRVGDKWTVMVVGGLSKGPMRFNALLRLIGGVSHRMLTLTLRGLEHDGLVKRTVYPSVPAKVRFTAHGRRQVVDQAVEWAVCVGAEAPARD